MVMACVMSYYDGNGNFAGVISISYDVEEIYRIVLDTVAGESCYRFAWHDRKAWWQQEQGILAYQILYGCLKKPEYLDLVRSSAAFYNTYFLDHDDGAVYFNVLNNGIPFLTGNERLKSSHSMACYHSNDGH